MDQHCATCNKLILPRYRFEIWRMLTDFPSGLWVFGEVICQSNRFCRHISWFSPIEKCIYPCMKIWPERIKWGFYVWCMLHGALLNRKTEMDPMVRKYNSDSIVKQDWTGEDCNGLFSAGKPKNEWWIWTKTSNYSNMELWMFSEPSLSMHPCAGICMHTCALAYTRMHA